MDLVVAKENLFRRDFEMPGCEFSQALAQRDRRGLRGFAVDVGARGRRGRRGIGHLARVGRRDAYAIDIDLQLFGHDLRDLDEQALSHLGPAVIQHQRAVRIDMQQAAGLVQVRGGERDAELDRGERDAALEHRTVGVEGADRLAPRVIVGALLELPHDVVDDVVDDRLVVVRDVAICDAVEIVLAHVQRVLAEMARDLVDHALDPHHALRPAEAPESRIGHGVGLAAEGQNADVFQVIAVVAVEHRAVVDRARQVRRVAAASGQHEIDAEDAALVVEADFVLGLEIVPLARHQHVVVAIHA